MRPSDVLMEDSDDDFSGESSFIVTDTRRRRRRRRRESCLSPRSLLFRWWSSSKKSKGQKIVEVKKSEDVSRRVGLERERKEEVGCSMNSLNGESSSCVSDLKEESEIDEVSASGQFRKEDCFNLAVGFGLFYLIAASKNELNKIIKLRTEMEMLLQNVKEEVENQNMEILCKPSKSNEIIACTAIDAQENLCSIGHVSLQHLLLLKNPADVETTQLYDQSMTCEAIRPEKCMKGIDQLEAELEAELERLQLHLDSDDIFEYPKQQRVEVTVEDTALVGSLSASFEVVVDPPEACTQEHYGVPSNELERRLHELLESRQQERIEELEHALECANQKLCEKEREVCWWKNTAILISQHVPKTSRLLP
ncbi:hypothetical protein ACSBR2_036755 [Camellia fascicularis]